MIYLDHAAATELDPRVRAVVRAAEENFGNPSAIYAAGRRARKLLEESRAKTAGVLNCQPEEVVFTGSGTESDNLAIFGIARAYAKSGRQLITSKIEHRAVLRPIAELAARENFAVVYLAPDEFGLVSPADLARALTPETILASLMYANNEIGTVLPIAEYAKAIRVWKKNNGRGPDEPPFLHTDACQAAGYLALDAQKLGVDLMTINGSKIYGPKGTGALFVRRGLKLAPFVLGGGQERGLRSGTENVPALAGFAEALAIANAEREAEARRLTPLRERLIAGIIKNIPDAILNGHAEKRLPNNVNVSILGIEGESVLLYLDEAGIAAATGSACDSSSLDPSHVILALGRPYEFAHASLRFTLGRKTTLAEIDYVLKVLPGIVKKLRAISPVTTSADGRSQGNEAAFVKTGRPHWER